MFTSNGKPDKNKPAEWMTIKELAEEFGMSRQGVKYHVDKLTKDCKKFVDKNGRKILLVNAVGVSILRSELTKDIDKNIDKNAESVCQEAPEPESTEKLIYETFIKQLEAKDEQIQSLQKALENANQALENTTAALASSQESLKAAQLFQANAEKKLYALEQKAEPEAPEPEPAEPEPVQKKSRWKFWQK